MNSQENFKIRSRVVIPTCRNDMATSMGMPWVGSRTSSSLLGEVAEASRGRSPPHAMMMLSAIWEMTCTVFRRKMAFSAELTKSRTDLVEWDRHTWKEKKCKQFRVLYL